MGRGLDGSTTGYLGFGAATNRSLYFDGFGQVIDLRMLSGVQQFEVYYNTDATDMPFNARSMMSNLYAAYGTDWDAGQRVSETLIGQLYSPGVEWYTNPRVKQVVGLDIVADIEVIGGSEAVNPHRYRIKLYRADQKGGFSGGKYTLVGEPIDVLEVYDPGNGTSDSAVQVSGLRKQVTVNYSCKTELDVEGAYYIEWKGLSGEYLASSRFGDFKKITTTSTGQEDPVVVEEFDDESLVYSVKNDGVIIRKAEYSSKSEFYKIGSSPEHRISASSIVLNPDNPDSRELKGVIEQDGDLIKVGSSTGPGWFWQDFDDYGRVTKRIDQLGANAFPASATPWPDTTNYTTENTYSGNTQATVTKRAGTVAGLSWRVWNGLTQVSDYVATDLAASGYGDATNLKTTTFYYAGNESTGGAEPWAVKAIVYPDQTASVYTYSYNTGTKIKTVTVASGKPDSTTTPSSISAGTKTETVTNAQGYVISSITTAVPSNVVLASEIVAAGNIDAFGRPTQIDSLDGTHVSRTYYPDFRGLVQTETDANGVTSTYTYDILNRVRTVVRDGVTTTITPAGLTSTTTYASSAGSRAVVSTVDLFGQLTSASNTFEPATTTAVAHANGKLTTTTTETISGLTVIKKNYEDGSLESVSGTGTKHYRYEYGVAAFTGPAPYGGKTLSYTKQILQTDGGGDSGSYVKTYTDGAGRTMVAESASGTGSGAAYAFSYYNDKGQLWKSVDPDGVVMLFEYDDQGRQTTVALDVNKSGTIDAGDEVTTTTTTYADSKATTITTSGYGTNAHEVSKTITTIASGATTVTRNGNNALATTITPDIATKKVTVSGADGSAIYEYDNNGQPKIYTVKDPSGATALKTTSYDHDKFGRLTQTTTGNAAGGNFSTTFNPDSTVASGTASGTGATSQSFSVAYSNPNGNRRMELTSNGKTQAVEFNAGGDLVKRSGFGTFDMELTPVRGANGTTTTLTTTASGAATIFSANAAGVTTGKTFAGNTAGPSTSYSSGGLPTSITTPAGANATYGYGSSGVERGLVKTITYPASTNTANVALDYDEQGRVKTITDASGTRTLTYEKDQLDKETYTAGPLSGLVVERSLDTRERRNGLTLTHGADTLYSVSYGYQGNTSALENVTKGIWSSHYTYKTDTRLIDKVTQKRNGTTVLITTRDYDAFQRLRAITSAAGSATTSYAYHYNATGQRDTITRENGDYWDIGYQAADGQLHTAVKKNSGGIAIPGYNYAYDFTGIGNRSKTATNDTPAVDREAPYTPNALNQVTSRHVPGFVDVLGSIDSLTNVTVDVRNQASPVVKKGTWTASTAGGGFNGTNYLVDGNAEKGQKWVDYSLAVTPGTYSVEMIWSAGAGNSSAVPVIINAGDTRKTQVVNQQANGGIWVSVGTYTMAAGGRLNVRIANMGTTGQVVADSVRIKRTTDTWVQIMDSEDATVVTTIAAAKLGEIFHLAIPVDNSAGPVAAKFDITGLLAGAGVNGTDAVASYETSAIIPPATTTLDHDLDGRLHGDWKWTYTWNAAGQLRSVESTTAYTDVGGPRLKLVFDYDAQGRRFSKKVYCDGATTPSDTLYFIYDGWNLIAELNSSLAVVRSYTWGPDISQSYQGAGGIGGLLSIQTGPTTTYFPTYDGSGNITGLVNATSGTADAVYEYAPFGEPVRKSGPAMSVSPFGFSTKYTDKETGFCYYGHRYYDPELGHWISREPLGEMESANLYAFCRNDPVNNLDYLGLDVNAVWNAKTTTFDVLYQANHRWYTSALTLGYANYWDWGYGNSSERNLGSLILDSNSKFFGFVNLGNGRVATMQSIKNEADSVLANFDKFIVGNKAIPMELKLGEPLQLAKNLLYNSAQPDAAFGHVSLSPERADAITGSAELTSAMLENLMFFYAMGPLSTSQSWNAVRALDVADNITLSASTIKVYRVEGMPNTRLIFGKNGTVGIVGDKMLFLNFGNRARAEEYLAQKIAGGLPGAQLKSFEVPKSFLEELQRIAVTQRRGRLFPDLPQVVDITTGANQFGLRLDQFQQLQQMIIQGTVRIHQ